MPERSIIHAQGCEQNINNWIFFFLLEDLESELVLVWKNRSTSIGWIRENGHDSWFGTVRPMNKSQEFGRRKRRGR